VVVQGSCTHFCFAGSSVHRGRCCCQLVCACQQCLRIKQQCPACIMHIQVDVLVGAQERLNWLLALVACMRHCTTMHACMLLWH
jgi:hypothetical protein